MTVRRRLHLLSVPLAMLGLASGLLFSVGTAAGPAGADDCVSRILILSAMPLELDPLLAHVEDESTPVVLNGRYFVTGTLEHQPVVLGLTGIGPINASTTTKDAFAYYQCDTGSKISGVVFSGTSGGQAIGSVYVPGHWTEDGVTFFPSTPKWLTHASDATQNLALEQTTPTGDPACVCALAGGVHTPVKVLDTPAVHVVPDGTGLTTDPFNGHASPCTPGGSDIDSCVPCRELDHSQVDQTTALAQGLPPLVDPGFVTSNLQSPPPGTYMTSDEETAEVAKLAQLQDVPFIGFRAASDGPDNTPGSGGDPLMLPGFPAQFVVYKQLAADNAATAAIAFLGSLPDS